jgi:hypothetical protein
VTTGDGIVPQESIRDCLIPPWAIPRRQTSWAIMFPYGERSRAGCRSAVKGPLYESSPFKVTEHATQQPNYLLRSYKIGPRRNQQLLCPKRGIDEPQ